MITTDVHGMGECNDFIPWNSSPFGHITVGNTNEVFMIPTHPKIETSLLWNGGSKVISSARVVFVNDIEPDLEKMIYPDTRPTEALHDEKPNRTALSDCFPNGIPMLRPTRWLTPKDGRGAIVRIKLPLRKLYTGDTEFLGVRSERRRGHPQLLCRAPYFDQQRSRMTNTRAVVMTGATTEQSLWSMRRGDAINIKFICDGADVGWDPWVVWFDGRKVFCHTQPEYLLHTGVTSGALAQLRAAWPR